MATVQQGPVGRGYERWLGYFHHANDYYTEGLGQRSIGTENICGNKYVDLWLTDGPADRLNGTAYEEELFTNHSLSVIDAHDPAAGAPLFLFHAFHLIHTPLQVPQAYIDRFSFVDNSVRRHYAAMVNYMDEVVGKIVRALKAKGMWGNTLLVASSDNGGPIYETAGANNFPLKVL
jgi:arylsulfatase I/J